jgi:DNA-binding transcriptional LysR family regulator
LLIFARVVEAKSFTAGAARLGISKSVASARIAALEERLGTRLLLRTTRRVNAPVVFAQLYLVEPIAAFLEQHPRVRVELLLADRLVDLVEEGIDVALRISARLRDSQLIGRKLCEDHTLVCASPAYLARRGTPREPAELIHHDCLRYSLLESADEWRFRDPARPRGESRSFSVPVEGRFHAQSGSVLREAALAGLGLAVLPSFMVARDLAAGTLLQVLAPYSFVRIAIQALYAPARVLPGNVRAFVDLLSQRFRKPPWAA